MGNFYKSFVKTFEILIPVCRYFLWSGHTSYICGQQLYDFESPPPFENLGMALQLFVTLCIYQCVLKSQYLNVDEQGRNLRIVFSESAVTGQCVFTTLLISTLIEVIYLLIYNFVVFI